MANKFSGERAIPEFSECSVQYNYYFHNKPSDIDVREDVDKIFIKERILDIISSLSVRQEDVLTARFGIKDGISSTLQEVGEMYGITRERVRQIEAKGLRKLRHPLLAEVFYELDGREKPKEEEEEEEEVIVEKRKAPPQEVSFNQRDLVARHPSPALMSWWDTQFSYVCKMMDNSLPSRTFIGKCNCQSWKADYRIRINQYEALCCKCFDKFWMELDE